MTGVALDLTITIGNIIEISVIASGGLFALSKMTTKFALFHADLGGVKDEMADMKSEIKKVNEVLIRMNAADLRIGRAEQDIRDIQHGRGFVQAEINREY